MPDALLERLIAERDNRLQLVRSITQTAADAERDLSDQDRETITLARTRMAAIDTQLELIGDNLDLNEGVRDRLARLQPETITPATVQYRCAGDLMHDMLHAHHDRDASQRYNRYLSRAAQHMGTTAAATTPTAGGFGGLLVVPAVGPVLSLVPSGRPLLTALGVQPMPNGWAFLRPRIVDPDLDTGVAVQSLQKAEVASKKFDILADNVAVTTVGGYLNVSQQLLGFVASSLDIIVGQMNRRLARAEEKAAITEMQASTAHVTLSDTATAAQVNQAIFDASALVYANTGELATWIAMGPLGWARLGGLTDTAGRPMFPFLGAANALGTMDAGTFGMTGPAGLQPVVTYGITDKAMYVGNQYGLEAYEYRMPLLEAVEPSVLGRQIAVGASLAFYRPTTKEAVTGGSPTPAEGNGVVKLSP